MASMPRLARAVAVGFAHRGNNSQDVFFVDDDRRVYLKLLKEQADKYSLELIGYCLMSNHTHNGSPGVIPATFDARLSDE